MPAHRGAMFRTSPWNSFHGERQNKHRLAERRLNTLPNETFLKLEAGVTDSFWASRTKIPLFQNIGPAAGFRNSSSNPYAAPASWKFQCRLGRVNPGFAHLDQSEHRFVAGFLSAIVRFLIRKRERDFVIRNLFLSIEAESRNCFGFFGEQ